MDVEEAIRTKRAVRSYAERSLPEPVIRSILHAGRLAPSARNRQPWHFIAITDRAVLSSLTAAGPYVDFVAESALSVAILTPPPGEAETILFDAGQAAAFMQLRAWELGVVSCLGSVHEQGIARQLLGYPNDLYFRIVIAFGYPRTVAVKPPRRGGRRSLPEVAHRDRWGVPLGK